MGVLRRNRTVTMSDIKITYFNTRGRAEISRHILSYAGVRFTDERLSPKQFGALKSSLPYGQVPSLNYKGQVLCQSITIARFLATEFGLGGRNNLEIAQADEIVDAVSDMGSAIIKVRFGLKEDLEKDLAKVMSTVVTDGLANLEKKLV